ncbi:MAG: N-acetylmuramoyl-L-alanine amidase [bacterium]|nr:N-acetylmuramoyl-L-alanine amidase [bacterium]
MRSNKLRLVLDPGHGGQSTGAVGSSGLTEKELNLKLVFLLKDLLESKFQVFLTREGDVDVPLEERVKFAETKDADIFISIHFNADALRNPNLNRTEVYIPFEESGPSMDLGELICEEFRSRFDIPCVGPIPSRYTVLKSKVPVKLLLECSYITNHEEEMKLLKGKRLEEISTMVASALIKFSAFGFCEYKGFEIREKLISFAFSEEVSRNQLKVFVDGKEFNYFQVVGKEVALIKEYLPYGFHHVEIKGRTLSGKGLPHVMETIEIETDVEYFTASILPYAGYQLIKIRGFDKHLNPIPEGVRLSIEKIEASVRAIRRGIYKPGELETIIEAKREISDETGSFYILLKGVKDEIKLNFSIGNLDGRLSVENVPKRKTNITGFVYDENTKKPLKNVLIQGEDFVAFSDEFGIFELERSREEEKEKVIFLKEGYYAFETELSTEFVDKIYLKPLYNGVLHGKKILIDIDNRDFSDYSAVRRSWKIAEILGVLVKSAGGIPVLTRDYPWQEIDDYSKVKKAVKECVDASVQISNSRLHVKDDLYVFFYERDENSRKFAEAVYGIRLYKDDPPSLIMPYGNYFVIQLSGPRIVINSKGIFGKEWLAESEVAKFIALKVFVGLLSYFGYTGVYYREYNVEPELLSRTEIFSEDFPVGIVSGNQVRLLFSRPDSKIVIFSKNGKKILISKPLEGKCITLPDGN